MPVRSMAWGRLNADAVGAVLDPIPLQQNPCAMKQVYSLSHTEPNSS